MGVDLSLHWLVEFAEISLLGFATPFHNLCEGCDGALAGASRAASSATVLSTF